MSDLRDLEPPQRIFDLAFFKGAAGFEFEIAAWPYSGLKNDRVMSRSLVYRVRCEDFEEAHRLAMLVCETVQAMHDIWIARIVRVGEARHVQG